MIDPDVLRRLGWSDELIDVATRALEEHQRIQTAAGLAGQSLPASPFARGRRLFTEPETIGASSFVIEPTR
jgi:hypothetical protein